MSSTVLQSCALLALVLAVLVLHFRVRALESRARAK
jgi:hypothetical protein